MQMAILCASHTLCWWDSGAEGGVFSCPSRQSAMAASITGPGLQMLVWRIKETRSEQAAADAKKVEGASCTALLIPNLF